MTMVSAILALLVTAGPTGAADTHMARVASIAPGRPQNAVLPDSVLATVGTRRVSVAEFRRAWRETHSDQAMDGLTPATTRGFLEVLIDRELIRTAATREHWAWTPEDSAAYAALLDRLTLREALERVLSATRSAGPDSAQNEQQAGVVARERAMEELAPRYEPAAIERMARAFAALPRPIADSSLAAQLRMLQASPVIDPTDSGAVLAHTEKVGEFRMRDLLGQWVQLSPAYRPHIEAPDQVRDLVANGLFERWLRREAQVHAAEFAPRIAETLERERERIAVDHLMAREVHGAIALDSVEIQRWFEAHATDWKLPTRYRVTRLALSDRDAATRLALDLRDPVKAERLVASALGRGVDYRAEIDAVHDSLAFGRARTVGTGAVTGPDPVGDAWEVLRVEALLPARARTWQESRDEAMQRWYDEQSADRLETLLERERRRTVVHVRERALDPATFGASSD